MKLRVSNLIWHCTVELTRKNKVLIVWEIKNRIEEAGYICIFFVVCTVLSLNLEVVVVMVPGEVTRARLKKGSKLGLDLRV